MYSLVDYKQYKKAKLILKDLVEIQRILYLSSQALKHYKKYVPVIDILTSIESTKLIIDVHCNKCLLIIKNRDEKNESELEKSKEKNPS